MTWKLLSPLGDWSVRSSREGRVFWEDSRRWNHEGRSKRPPERHRTLGSSDVWSGGLSLSSYSLPPFVFPSVAGVSDTVIAE